MQVFTVSLASDLMAEQRMVTIAYAYRVLVQQYGHLFHLDFSKPTKNARVHFAHGNCGIHHVSLLDYIASSTQPGLSRLPASEPTPSIALRLDGWTLPKAGVALSWVPEREMAPTDGVQIVLKQSIHCAAIGCCSCCFVRCAAAGRAADREAQPAAPQS